jgi:predicted regulator of Ras-like GTPase activity (Roadblock/LC7/MglB family)
VISLGIITRWKTRRMTNLLISEGPVVEEIRELRMRLPHVMGVLVASVDGLLIAEDAPNIEPETMAAMSAAQLGLGQQIVAAVNSGGFRETVTTGTNGYVATFAAGSSALLSVIAGPELNVGRLHHEARPVAARIGELLPDPSLTKPGE